MTNLAALQEFISKFLPLEKGFIYMSIVIDYQQQPPEPANVVASSSSSSRSSSSTERCVTLLAGGTGGGRAAFTSNAHTLRGIPIVAARAEEAWRTEQVC